MRVDQTLKYNETQCYIWETDRERERQISFSFKPREEFHEGLRIIFPLEGYDPSSRCCHAQLRCIFTCLCWVHAYRVNSLAIWLSSSIIWKDWTYLSNKCECQVAFPDVFLLNWQNGLWEVSSVWVSILVPNHFHYLRHEWAWFLSTES